MGGPLPTEAELVELAKRVQQGDHAAEEEFARLFAPSIEALAGHRLRNPEDARELVDDVLVAALLALRKGAVREPDRLPGFVHGIAKKLIKSHYRRQARQPATEQIAPELSSLDVIPGYEREDQVRVCRRALAKLGPIDRRILYLTLVEGLRAKEISQLLEMSAAAVRQRKSRAVKQISSSMRASPRRDSISRRQR